MCSIACCNSPRSLLACTLYEATRQLGNEGCVEILFEKSATIQAGQRIVVPYTRIKEQRNDEYFVNDFLQLNELPRYKEDVRDE